MAEQEKVVQIGVPDERERRRRRYELLAAFLLLLLVLGGTWTQLTLYGVDSWMFIALLNINSIFMLVILFLVARNVVKLIMERRRKVFGAQIRTRLVVVFVSLSLIPTVIMFLASNRVVATSVDYWFTRQTETSLQAALDVGQSFYAAAAERLHSRSEAIAQEAASSVNRLLQTKQKEYGLTLVGFVTPQEKELYWHAPQAFTEGWQEARTRIDWAHVARATFGSLLWATDDADYVIGVLAIDGGETGYLITAESIGQGLLAKLERISKGFEEYAQLKQLKKPLKVSFLLILGVLGMITIFGSVWFGFRLSKEFTAPILALAQGTTRIAQGDLDFRLEDKGADELGLLVQSFNHMAKDLQEGRMSLTHANAMLAEHNRYIETVLDNITTGVITLDADGRIQTMNKAASSIFDAQAEKLTGRNPAEFLPRSYSNIFVSMLETLREHPEQNWKRQEDFLLGDRSWKLILHAVALSGPGGIRAYVIVVEDITELEKIQVLFILRKHTLIPTCYQHGIHMKPERTRNRSGSTNTQKRPHATRAACVFPGRNKTESDFSQTNGKSQTELHKNRPLFLKEKWFRDATSRNHLQKHFWREELLFGRLLYGLQVNVGDIMEALKAGQITPIQFAGLIL